MATYQAVGAVGLTLQTLLRDRLDDPNGGSAIVPVSLGPPGPDRDPAGAVEPARVNLFLYQVAENAFLKNQDLPGIGHAGSYGQPPLSLILHYLLTVFGSTANGDFFDETPAHLLLGSAMRVLHDHGIITDAVVTRRAPAGVPVLDPALHGEHENVKLTLQPLGLEEISNVWTSLDLSYRLSVAYEVNVVQIESTWPRRYPRPVQELPGGGPRVYTVTLRRPVIKSMAVRRPGEPPETEHTVPFARVGDTLIIKGTNFGNGNLLVRLGAITTTPAAVSAAGDRLEAVVPDDLLPDGTPIPADDRLQPGTHAVEVAVGVSALPHSAVASGRAAFVLVPRVASAAAAGRVLTVTGTRLMAEGVPTQLVVGDAVVEGADYLVDSTPAQITVRLPTTLPTSSVGAVVSGSLAPFPAIPDSFDLTVTIGTEGPFPATIAGRPGTIAEAAALLEAAIRAAAVTPAFTRAHVVATNRALIVVAGDGPTVTVGAGPLADALRLSADGARRAVFLSGALRFFPRLSSAIPEADLTIGATTRRVTLQSVPRSLAAAAAALEQGIRNADPAAAYANARVIVVGDQICLLPGEDSAVSFAAAAGSDETTVAELQLAANYLVRVRVDGVESVDESIVRLPA